MAAATPKDIDRGKNLVDGDRTFDVVVIGAGWAGLAAAKTLLEQGHRNICVVEARDYVGGRSVTSYDCDGTPVDLGSSWIHGNEKRNPIQALVEDLELPHAPCGGEGNWPTVSYDAEGKVFGKKRLRRIIHTKNKFLKYMERQQGASSFVSTNLSRSNALRHSSSSLSSSSSDDESSDEDMTLDDCLKKFMEFEGIAVGSDMEECLRWILTLDISFEYAAPLDELSLQYWDIDDEFDGDDSYLAVENGGYSAVVNKYAESVQEFVRLRSKVKAIEYGSDAVITILCSSTDAGEEFSLVSKNIIVTLPLGVLQAGSVQFAPELPEATRAS